MMDQQCKLSKPLCNRRLAKLKEKTNQAKESINRSRIQFHQEDIMREKVVLPGK
jgi:hypothetical protein